MSADILTLDGKKVSTDEMGELVMRKSSIGLTKSLWNDDDRYIKEDPFADIIMGLTNSIRYKSWDFSITARASIGNYAYNNLASNAVFNAAASVNNILNNIH